MKSFIVVHYGEIGLKKGNAPYFEKKLRKRIKHVLEQRFRSTFSVKHVLKRYLIELPEDFSSKADKELYVRELSKVFGIKTFKFMYEGPLDVGDLGEEIWNKLQNDIPNFHENFEHFRVRVKRSMEMDITSMQAERSIGAELLKRGIDLKVKMKDADLVVHVQFLNGKSYFSFNDYKGLGGLPPNSQGKLVSLISAGIDSPVAAYRMMRRGARVIFVHFHSYPYSDKDEMEQVEDLVKVLAAYQFDTKLYLVPFGDIQKEMSTMSNIPDQVRTVLYRRVMLRIAEFIARKNEAKGLITGDSFGQVASQTPENIFAIHEASSIPLFQPLISFDKEEIIEESRKIGAFEISKLPCKDTCVLFAPDKPELKANAHDLNIYEKDFPLERWIADAFSAAEIKEF